MHNNILSKYLNENVHSKFYGYTLELLLNILSMKSVEITEHCIRVSRLACAIGESLKLSNKEMEDLYISSILHDIGKIFIEDEILNKPSKLTNREYEIIKTHSMKGFSIMKRIEELNNVSKIILYHHERYDGKGYPCGIKGKESPLLSRIISVADAFDAMTSTRYYKVTLSFDEAVEELKEHRFTQFDGDIVDSFIACINSRKSALK